MTGGLTELEVDAVILQFETFMATTKKKVRCRLCLHADRKEFNRSLLTRSESDAKIAAKLGLEKGLVRHHRQSCLRTRGGANQGHRSFPVYAKPPAQKHWVLEEMVTLRDQAIKDGDHKSMFKLIKAIDEAADAFHKATKEAREATKQRKAEKEENAALEFSEETQAAMNQVRPTAIAEAV